MYMRNIVVLFFLIGVAVCWSGTRMLQTDGGFSDPLCAVFDQQTGDCISCICRGYFDQNHRCKPINDLCQTWNINTGECTSCYRGYELINGTCTAIEYYIPGNDSELTIDNPNCQTSYSNGTCISCRPYYILYCNDCQTTGENPFCSKFDQSNICVECDIGYGLDVNNVCQKEEDSNTTSCLNFQNCLECNSSQCTKCEDGYRQQYESKECVLPTTNCSEECALCSPNECFTCAEGYSSQSWPPCINCAFMYSRNSQGKCKAILSDCSAFPNCQQCVVGECRVCNTGYKLDSNQSCVLE